MKQLQNGRRRDRLMTDTIKIFVVDDHPLFRYGLMSVLSEYPEFQVVGDAANSVEALPRIEEVRPDIVIMDIFMPNSDGVKTTYLDQTKDYLKPKLLF